MVADIGDMPIKIKIIIGDFMFYLVGDFVRLGVSMSDPYHSLKVSEERDVPVFVSLNRVGHRKLQMHIWRIVDSKTGLLEHIHSEPFSPLWDRYIKAEASRAGSLE